MKVGLLTLGCDKNTVDSERYLAELIAHGAESTTRPRRSRGHHRQHVRLHRRREARVDRRDRGGRTLQERRRLSGRGRRRMPRAAPQGRARGGAARGRPLPRRGRDRPPDSRADRARAARAIRSWIIPVFACTPATCRTFAISRSARAAITAARSARFRSCAASIGRSRWPMSFVKRSCSSCRARARSTSSRRISRTTAAIVRDGIGLPELLESLVAETSIPWIRMLYLYSAGLTPKLLELMASEPRILRYLDMPMQHASDAVLKRMRRPERQATQRERVQRIRDVVPDVAIRTTCIVGFPGETEDDFQQLLDFLEEMRFDRVGAFTYSAQEGTRAWSMPDDVPDDVKRERLERLTELQRMITAERYEAHIGTRARVLVDRRADESGRAQARAPWQADDVDGVTRVVTDAAPGDFVEVEIDAVEDDYDFAATAMRIVDRHRAAPRSVRLGRVLPVATTVGQLRALGDAAALPRSRSRRRCALCRSGGRRGRCCVRPRHRRRLPADRRLTPMLPASFACLSVSRPTATVTADGLLAAHRSGYAERSSRASAARRFRSLPQAAMIKVVDARGTTRELASPALTRHASPRRHCHAESAPLPRRAFDRRQPTPVSRIINRVGVEAYLRGVVPRELGVRGAGDRAALEAQAVAARSYAVARLGNVSRALRPRRPPRATRSTVVWTPRTASADAAVAATEGLVLTYDGRVVSAPYHSTCGGSTAAPDRAVAVGERTVSSACERSDSRQRSILLRHRAAIPLGAQLASATHSTALVERYLRSYAQVPAGPVGAVRGIVGRWPNDLGPSRRARGSRPSAGDIAFAPTTFVMCCARRVASFSTVRIFRPRSSARSDGRLTRLTIRGLGYGHGVGMCQWGAIGRARAGQDFRTILRTYFPGTTVARAY